MFLSSTTSTYCPPWSEASAASGTSTARSWLIGKRTRAKRPGTSSAIGVREDGAQLDRAGLRIDPVARVVDAAGVREARVGREREARLVARIRRAVRRSALLAIAQQLRLAHLEVGVDRVRLHDRGEQRGAAGSHQVADVDQVAVDHAVERGIDVRVGEVQLARRRGSRARSRARPSRGRAPASSATRSVRLPADFWKIVWVISSCCCAAR